MFILNLQFCLKFVKMLQTFLASISKRMFSKGALFSRKGIAFWALGSSGSVWQFEVRNVFKNGLA